MNKEAGIATSLMVVIVDVLLMVAMTPKPGMAWIFYGGLSLIASVNLVRVAWILLR